MERDPGGVILSEEVMIPPVIETGKTVSKIQKTWVFVAFFFNKRGNRKRDKKQSRVESLAWATRMVQLDPMTTLSLSGKPGSWSDGRPLK